MTISHAVCDTVVLIIEKDKFEIKDLDSFTPSASLVFRSRNCGTVSSYQNPSKKDLGEHNFKPCLTLTKSPRVGGMSTILKISMSLPKLIKGNNFEEVTDADFSEIIDKLQQKLQDMSVIVSKDTLINARVCKVDYAKNIILPRGVDCSLIISEIEHSEFSRSLDVGRSDYRDQGHCARIHCNGWELAIYDKIRDVCQAQKSDKRAFEKDSAYQGINLDAFNGMSVLRIETRLNSSDQIRKILSKVGEQVETLSFSALFSSRISSKINGYFWEQVKKNRKILALSQDNPELLFRRLASDFKPLQALQLMGLWCGLKCVGSRELKYILRKSVTIPKLVKKLKAMAAYSDWKEEIFEVIHDAIRENKALIIEENLHDRKYIV